MYSNRTRQILLAALLILIGISFLLPFYYMFITSLKPMDGYIADKFLPPASPSMENYRWAFERQNLVQIFGNNILILAGTLIPFIFLTTGTGFVLGKFKLPFGRINLLLIAAVMILPQMVVTVPLYRELSQLRLLNSNLGLGLVYLAYFGPYSAYLMTTYYRNVPDTYIQAALIDGAGLFTIYTRIMLPLARPMVMTVIIIATQQIWNELTFALILIRTASKRTIMATMAMLSGQYGMNAVNAAAMLLIASLPMLLAYLVFQKNIQQGILAGGIKE